MLYLKISDIVFSFDYSEHDNTDAATFINTYLYKYLADYICQPQSADYHIKFTRGEKFEETGDFIASYQYYKVYKSTETDTVTFAFCQPDKYNSLYYTYAINISDNWKNAEFVDYMPKSDRLSNKPCVSMFVGMFFYIQGVLLMHKSFILHGVSLSYKNKGLVFSAASGVGKTTHTDFWVENFGAEVLNGDTPIIKLIDGKPFIYGSPWCGKSNISVNKIIPLNAVVIISRGTENKIRKLNNIESVGYLFNHMKRPSWDIESTNICLDCCESVINSVNIYKLECLPNKESAEVALKGIIELNG